MKIKRLVWFSLLITVVLFLNACTQQPIVDPLETQAALEQKEVDYSNPETYVVADSTDAAFLELSDKIEGFSGLYIDDDKTLTVGLTSTKDAQANEAFIAETVVNTFDPDLFDGLNKAESGLPKIKFVQQDYSFRELNTWKNHAHKLFGKGVTFLDADEHKNRIVIGIEDEAAKAEVLKAYQEEKLPIPEAALEFAFIPVAQPLANINNSERPVVGGLEIRRSGYGCTLAYNATRFGVSGFITNSHCSSNMGWPDGSVQSQISSAIGYEIHDPSFDYSWWPWVCSPGFRCRESDSAFYKYYSGVSNIGHVADVTYYNNASNGSHTYNITRDVLSSSYESIVYGATVYKVGATSGGTTGNINSTCASILVGFSNRILKCQSTAYMRSAPGDSGSPVFSRSGSNVKATGILWGKPPALNFTYFSRMSAVLHELNLSIGTF